VALSLGRGPNLLMIKYLPLGVCQSLSDIDQHPQWTRQLRLRRRDIFFAKSNFCPQLKPCQAGLTSKARNQSGLSAWTQRRLAPG